MLGFTQTRQFRDVHGTMDAYASVGSRQLTDSAPVSWKRQRLGLGLSTGFAIQSSSVVSFLGARRR